MIFNPSFPYRLVHTVFAAYLTTALVVGAVGAWHLLRDRARDGAPEGARVMFSMAMGMITVVAPLQILAGDQHGHEAERHGGQEREALPVPARHATTIRAARSSNRSQTPCGPSSPGSRPRP